MVYMTKTLELCHPLTEDGEREYKKLLEMHADEILFKSKHPVRYWLQRAKNLAVNGDSTWDGAHLDGELEFKDGFSYST